MSPLVLRFLGATGYMLAGVATTHGAWGFVAALAISAGARLLTERGYAPQP